MYDWIIHTFPGASEGWWEAWRPQVQPQAIDGQRQGRKIPNVVWWCTTSVYADAVYLPWSEQVRATSSPDVLS